MWRGLVWLVFVFGCVRSGSVECDNGTLCPAGTHCDSVHDRCVTQSQLDSCANQPDGTTCTYEAGSGECNQSVCFVPICGNGFVELPEVCDDGNVADEPLTQPMRCASNCLSNEVCGNGVTDLVTGEQCDDGNLLDHDGCASDCRPETYEWSQLVDPDPASAALAAYDVARDKVVLYGGANNSVQSDTAEWDGLWRGKIPTAPPGVFRDAAMAYFAPLHAVILEGGLTSNGPDVTTWMWDGVQWTQLANGPMRTQAAMAYDAKRKRLVLFGGSDGGKAPAETWEFDGTTWTNVAVSGPSGRAFPGMAYDPARGVIVMYGGKDSNGTWLSETWEYDGQSWRHPTASVPVIKHSPLVYLASHGVVMVGGFDASDGGTSTMYMWNGTSWTTASTPVGVRGWHALSEDGRGGIVLFGGTTAFTGGSVLGDTWAFDGTTWKLASDSPLPRMGFGTVNTRDRVVLFGGAASASSYPSDTWELTSRGWTKYTSAAPPGTLMAALVYDEKRDTVVMFGGQKNGSTLDDTTWIRSGTTWTSVHPTPSPVGRSFHGLAYDVVRSETVLFGGQTSTGLSAETWTFDGAAWHQKTPAHSPSARVSQAMAYDRVNNVVLLYGGATNGITDSSRDLWAWDGTDWKDITPVGLTPPLPVPTTLPALIWDPYRHSFQLHQNTDQLGIDTWELEVGLGTWKWSQVRTVDKPTARQYFGEFRLRDQSSMVILGGRTTAFLTDAWMLRLEGDRAHDSCQRAVDSDGDDKIGCDDPDCWPICTPMCPPATSCAAGAKKCGDGTCDAMLETCHNCPMDCTCAAVCGDHSCDPGETSTTCPGDCP